VTLRRARGFCGDSFGSHCSAIKNWRPNLRLTEHIGNARSRIYWTLPQTAHSRGPDPISTTVSTLMSSGFGTRLPSEWHQLSNTPDTRAEYVLNQPNACGAIVGCEMSMTFPCWHPLRGDLGCAPPVSRVSGRTASENPTSRLLREHFVNLPHDSLCYWAAGVPSDSSRRSQTRTARRGPCHAHL